MLEEKYSSEEYEKLKANQGRPLHVWQLDMSVHNNTGKPLDFLSADFNIESPWPPCTNWSGEGPGGGPAGDFVDAEGHPKRLTWADTLKVLSMPYGMRVGQVERDTVFLSVFHEDRPVFKNWSVDFTFARQGFSGAASPGGAIAAPPPGSGSSFRPGSWPTSTCARPSSWCRRKTMRGPGRPWRICWPCSRSMAWNPIRRTISATPGSGRRREPPSGPMEAAVRYLQIRGREAEHYDEALDLINRAETEQARAESGAGAPGGPRPGSRGLRVGETVVFDGMEFVGIPPGEFRMGSNSRHARGNEKSVTRVRISQGFYLGKHEVTQSQWQAVMGNNPSRFAGCGRCPVEQVSWEDVQAFIGRLNARSGGERYRLPTEGGVGVCGPGGDDDRHLHGGCDRAGWQ